MAVFDEEYRALLREYGMSEKEIAEAEKLPPSDFFAGLEALPVSEKVALFVQYHKHGRDFRQAALEAFEEGRREGVASASAKAGEVQA